MFLSRVIFKRGRQRAILQGMIHIGPNALYELLQYDIDWAQSNGYQVFFEGIKKEPFSSLRTANELKIRNFFNLLFEYYPVFSESFGLSLQQKNILLP